MERFLGCVVPLFPVVLSLGLAGLMWLGSFLRRDGALPFALVFPVWFFSAFLALCAGVGAAELAKGSSMFLLAAPSAGWIVSVLLLRFALDRQVTLSESLLIASAGWMPVLGLLYLFARSW